ncbi:hypothetical protein GCM10027034_30070 [Ramlibacter solisilvae]|uniref:Candidate membrane protein n=1 Tax=Ramlibacter tataouinensis TaxID=94132 RepID=A0A127JRL6_9BURK|nr:hypothetical protein [Ramlibacter tataouinensis]AMO22587.1 hypothetical protein UC35_06420 [Ramlibacter tataouinensis]
MDPLLLIPLLLIACWMLKSWQQGRRIALLGHFLSRHRIEKNMETLTQGYLRALGEAEPDRQQHVWGVLRPTEQELCSQVTRLASDFASADPALVRVSLLPIWVPFSFAIFRSFDMREALAIHARGIRRAIDANAATSPRERAFAISAELFLMQHTCHWFCRTKTVASARMLSRHQTSYDQLVSAVTPQTRSEYLALVRHRGQA